MFGGSWISVEYKGKGHGNASLQEAGDSVKGPRQMALLLQ
jgi:hypothetical protein